VITIFILALNVVRQQRLIVILLSTWLLFFAGLFSFISDPDNGPQDLEILYRQELVYGIAIGLFSGASMIHNERKSRRILAVLSKGIHRAQYLGGAMLGIGCITALFYALVAVTNQWLIHRLHHTGEVFAPALLGWVATQVAVALGLTFGSFLHPILAATCASLVSALGMLIPTHPLAFPVSTFVRSALGVTYAHGLGWEHSAGFIATVAIETATAFTIAALIFERRDITVPVE
jgi:ABC-type transport system involved in multi-copper enzyme maturation permease subunit